MNLKRMKRLRRVAERIDPEHFDMAIWAIHRGEKHPDLVPGSKTFLQDCGTTACLLGWAASDPAFQRDGLHLALDNVFSNEHRQSYNLKIGPRIAGERYYIHDFFDIDERAADLLFFTDIPPHYGVVSTLLKRIDHVIEHGGRFDMPIPSPKCRLSEAETIDDLERQDFGELGVNEWNWRDASIFEEFRAAARRGGAR